MMIEWSWYWKW